MAIFHYTAMNRTSAIENGILEANTRAQALRLISNMGLQPVKLRSSDAPDRPNKPAHHKPTPQPASSAAADTKLNGMKVLGTTSMVLYRQSLRFLGAALVILAGPRFLMAHTPLSYSTAGEIVDLILIVLFHAVLVTITINDLRGERVRLGRCLGHTLKKCVPLLITSIIATLAMGMGFLLFIIPGIIIASALFVTIPVLMDKDEDTGTLFALTQSDKLTKGSRWTIFGLHLVLPLLFLMMWAVSEHLSYHFPASVLFLWVTGIFTFAVLSVAYSIMSAVTYVDLRDCE